MAKKEAAMAATTDGTSKSYTSFYLTEEARSGLDRLVEAAGAGASRSSVVSALIDGAASDGNYIRISQLAAELAKLTGVAKSRPGRKGNAA